MVPKAMQWAVEFFIENLVWEASGGLLLEMTREWWKRRRKPGLPAKLTLERFDENGTLRERLTIRADEDDDTDGYTDIGDPAERIVDAQTGMR